MKTGWFTYVTLVALHKVCFPVTKGRKMHTPVKCEASSHTFYHLQARVCMYCDACTERHSQFPAKVRFSTSKVKKFDVVICSHNHIYVCFSINDKL